MHRIHDPVFGYIPLEDYETKLIDCLLIQRLRNIHQQGTAYLTYPSSTHTRFSHSLGVMKLSTDIVNIIKRKSGIGISGSVLTLLTRAMRLITLFHDIGHGPFSHLSERVFAQNLSASEKKEMSDVVGTNSVHEYFTHRLMKEYVPKYLEHMRQDYSDVMAKSDNMDFMAGGQAVPFDSIMKFIKSNAGHFFCKDDPWLLTEVRKPTTFKYWKVFKQILDSDFDVDKLDYIQRDGYVTGVKFGHLDVSGLYENLEINEVEALDNGHNKKPNEEKVHWNDLAFGRSALSAIETLVIERYKLYKWLNFHHTVCFSDEVMTRVMELSQNDMSKKNMFNFNTFESIAKADLERFESGKQRYDVELFDDSWVVENVRRAYKSQRKTSNDLKLARYYLGLLENRTFYDAVWRVDSELDSDEERILFELKDIIVKESRSGIKPRDGLVGKLEIEIAEKLQREPKDILISHKPFEPVSKELEINILTDENLENITEVSGLISLLQYRRNNTPMKVRKSITEGLLKLIGKSLPNVQGFGKKITQLLADNLMTSTQIYTPVYVFVKKLDEESRKKTMADVIRIISRNLVDIPS